MKKLHLAIGLGLLILNTANADIKSVPAISVSNGVSDWVRSLQTTLKSLALAGAYPANGYTECAEVKEIPGSYLCLSDTQQTMNLTFARCTLFSEGDMSVRRGTVVEQTDPTFVKAQNIIDGHDLEEADLMAFYNRAQTACKASADFCLNAQEMEFFTSIVLPKSESLKPIAFMSCGIDNGPYVINISHEVKHAQYFINPLYRSTVDQFWTNKVTTADKNEIKQILSDFYDASNQYLMRNEFQAFLLEEDARNDELAGFVAKYQNALERALNDAGVTLVRVQ